MIVVKCELWPYGDEKGACELCRAYITNDGETSRKTRGTLGSYDARFMQSAQFDPSEIWRKGRAENIHRTHHGIWDILYVRLRSAGLEIHNPAVEKERKHR